MMTNLGNGSEEWKTKVMSMLEAGVNTTENRYRVTIDKRTTWVGQGSRIRYTMCSGNTAGQCQEPITGFQSWDRTVNYFWKFTGGRPALPDRASRRQERPPIRTPLAIGCKARMRTHTVRFARSAAA